MPNLFLCIPRWGKCSLVLFVFALLFHSPVHATYYLFTGPGVWTDASKWTPSYPGLSINTGDTAALEWELGCILPAGVTLTVNGMLVASAFTNQGTLQNNGKILSGLFIYNNGTFINNGTLVNTAQFFNNGFLENRAYARVQNSFIMKLGGTVNNDAHGRFEIQQEGSVQITGTMQSPGNISTYGPVIISPGGSLRFWGGWANNSVITDSGTFTIQLGGLFYNQPSGTITMAQNGQLINNGEFENYGAITVCNSCIIHNGNPLAHMTNFANLSLDGTLDNDPGATFLNSSNGAVTRIPGEKMVSISSGQLTIGALATFNNNSICTNDGTIGIGGTFNNKDSFTNTNTLAVLAEGLFTNNGYAANTGTLTNNGGGAVNWTQPVLINKAVVITSPNSQFSISVSGFIGYFGSRLSGYTKACNCYAITAQPQSQNANAGGQATFTVTAISGAGPAVSYAWFVSPDGTNWKPASGGPFSGDTTATLMINPVPPEFNNFQFKCLVAGPQPQNQVYTNPATLTVGK